MRERLLEQVRARLARFDAGEDPATVLGPGAVIEVLALLAAVPDPAADIEVALAAGWLFWSRYLVGNPGEDEWDRAAAVRMFARVYKVIPDAVPAQVRGYLDGRTASGVRSAGTGGQNGADTPADPSRQGVAATATPGGHLDRFQQLSELEKTSYERFRRTECLADLDAAIDAARQAAAVPSHPLGGLSTLGASLALGGASLRLCAYLHKRFDRTGQLADLNDEIRVLRNVVAISAEYPGREIVLSNLGAALGKRFQRTNDWADLYYSRGFPVRDRAAAQRDMTSAGCGYIVLPPSLAVDGQPVSVAVRAVSRVL